MRREFTQVRHNSAVSSRTSPWAVPILQSNFAQRLVLPRGCMCINESDAAYMLNVTKILISHVGDHIASHHRELYPQASPARLEKVLATVEQALGSIGTSDALYHNVEHTAHVTLVGLHILRGKQHSEHSVTQEIWCDTTIALLCHDIGYVRRLCRSDTATELVTGNDGRRLDNFAGNSDAVLMPIHVNRGKRFIEEQFIDSDTIDIGFVNACIERTRFPVPEDPWYRQTDDYLGLVRAADLIGQLSDPRYLHKLSAIFYEFEEVGFNDSTGYERPGDLLTAYPGFFEACVAPYISDAKKFLEKTAEGKDVLDHLYGNLAAAQDAADDSLPTAATS